MKFIAISALSFGSAVYAQQAGSVQAETHPRLTVSNCNAAGTCTPSQQSIVLDANWRWLRVNRPNTYTNCYTGTSWDTSVCSSPTACAANCALEGADYRGTYGISTSGNALTLSFVTGANVGSRVYLMAPDDQNYQMFNLLNKEFTFTVDNSRLGCGLNGALYFSEMDADGGLARYSGNQAGAEYGTGYCDAQCARDLKFINGAANIEGWTGIDDNSGTGNIGSCCSEMDIWEANSLANAFTPHPCRDAGQVACTSDEECGVTDRYSGFCDRDGCDFNPYRQGNQSFYGSGSSNVVDSSRPVTVVTQFLTSDGTDTGVLSEIRRVYVQDGQVIQNSQSLIPGVPGDSVTDEYCEVQKDVFGDRNEFAALGGNRAQGEAFGRGMVLAMSVWDDYFARMAWLDSAYPFDADVNQPGIVRGPCDREAGYPEQVREEFASASVTFSDIRSGPIGSTFSST